MIQDNLRQSNGSDGGTHTRTNGRVTRGYSNLPKEEPKVESSSSSEEQSESENPPKTKKIHHMTLKAMERRKLLIQQGISVREEKSVEITPKKRGRPKGSRKLNKEEKEDYQVNIQDSKAEQEQGAEGKKQIHLRKRREGKKMVEPQSLDEKKEDLIEVEVAIELPAKQIEPKTNLVPQSAPKKRGRKKKEQTESQPVPQSVVYPPTSALKIYTVPKAQTYDNYLKYYDKILESTKEGEKTQIPLIFDKFGDPEAYSQLISSLAKR